MAGSVHKYGYTLKADKPPGALRARRSEFLDVRYIPEWFMAQTQG
jgi:hypothetical protein